ncbi:MAG: hypothetical protein A4S09_03730 [Proteobacteria bacterium SG_bin7]|nr:MAG: hypothetical protein A4S09_03730 [Proteobacteria bacterium SG_bin7]
MKGIVFTEFLEMVEEKFGLETADKVITTSKVENGGAYTAVGTYNHKDILEMVTALASLINSPVSPLVKVFGHHLAKVFVKKFPDFFSSQKTLFDFLISIDGYIHVEVRKLYPEAELPTFSHRKIRENCLELTYKSQRPFADLASGLIDGCIEHYGEKIKVSYQDLDDNGCHRRFTLVRELI